MHTEEIDKLFKSIELLGINIQAVEDFSLKFAPIVARIQDNKILIVVLDIIEKLEQSAYLNGNALSNLRKQIRTQVEASVLRGKYQRSAAEIACIADSSIDMANSDLGKLMNTLKENKITDPDLKERMIATLLSMRDHTIQSTSLIEKIINHINQK